MYVSYIIIMSLQFSSFLHFLSVPLPTIKMKHWKPLAKKKFDRRLLDATKNKERKVDSVDCMSHDSDALK